MKITINIKLNITSGKISWRSVLRYKENTKEIHSQALTFKSARHCAISAVRSSIAAVKTQANINIYIDTCNNAALVHELSDSIHDMKSNEKGHVVSINIS